MQNYRTEYLIFEVADFKTLYHAILCRPMLARFMAIPHHTYLVLKMPAPNGILSVFGDIETSYKCDVTAVELAKTLAYSAKATAMVAEARKTDPKTLQVPEQDRTSTALVANPKVKKVCLGLSDVSKTVSVGADLDPK